MLNKGIFIVLDGPDGSGTTTHAALLTKHLIELEYNIFQTSEPTKGPIGRWIRNQLRNETAIAGLPLQLLFCADRALHLQDQILPALRNGKIVICDRYTLSTLVYSRAQKIDDDALSYLNDKFLKPDMTIFTLPPLGVCIDRIQKRGVQDVFEKADFQKEIHRQYKAIMKEDASIIKIDTSGHLEETSKKVAARVVRFLKEREKTDETSWQIFISDVETSLKSKKTKRAYLHK